MGKDGETPTVSVKPMLDKRFAKNLGRFKYLLLFFVVTASFIFSDLNFGSTQAIHQSRVLVENSTKPEERPVGSYVLDWFLILVLLALSALCSGLTLGLMSLDTIGLEIVIGGEPDSKDAEYARKILPIRKNGNLLLCTLILGNVCVNSTTSIILASYTSGAVGIVVSTALIVVFAEILPQASGHRYALLIGARTRYIVVLLMILLYPAAKPISMMLEWLFGPEAVGSLYSANQLTKLLDIHAQHNQINENQVKVLHGAIAFENKLVKDVMTPRERIFMLDAHQKLDFNLMYKVFQLGYSRIPVFKGDQNEIIGILLVKDLLLIDPEDEIKVDLVVSFFGRPVEWLWQNTKLSAALALFKSGRGHLAMIRNLNDSRDDQDPFYEVVGLVTMEDIIEELIQDEIFDEFDVEEQIKLNLSSGASSGNMQAIPKCEREAFDLDTLKWFVNQTPITLTELQKIEICKFLVNEVKPFAAFAVQDQPYGFSPILKDLVETSSCVELKMLNQELYRIGKPMRQFTLVLEGQLRILSGEEKFPSTVGPWAYLGSKMLVAEATEVYLADFSAKCISKILRCLRISKRDYDCSLKNIHRSYFDPKHNSAEDRALSLT